MISKDDFQNLFLKGVKPLRVDYRELGRGTYGRVYGVLFNGMVCAAKEILVEGVEQAKMQRTAQLFIKECHQCTTLRHPHVIQFLGIFYPLVGSGSVQVGRMRLPVMVMEMMADSLTSLVDKHEKIPVHIKYSIVHDVSLGLCYLHNHDPPIVHGNLFSNNILLTAHHVAKISDVGLAKIIEAVKPDGRKTMTDARGPADFMPPESFKNSPDCNPTIDLFSFAGIILHTFNQQWPHPTEQVPKTLKNESLSEVNRRQQYLDKLRAEGEILRPLVEACLNNDPALRPNIATVREIIRRSKSSTPKDVITLCRENELLQNRLKEVKLENKNEEIDQLKSEILLLQKQMV